MIGLITSVDPGIDGVIQDVCTAPPIAIPGLTRVRNSVVGPRLHIPDWQHAETVMKHALDAIRDTARIAWWDGSALGLRLNRLMDIFGTEDAEPGIEPAKIRS